MKPSLVIGGMFGLHRLPFSEWIAAALAVPVTYGLHLVGQFPLVLAFAVGLTGVTFWAHRRVLQGMVLDRFAGQILALTSLSGGLWAAGVAPHIFPYPGWVGAFVICQGLILILDDRLPEHWNDTIAGAATAIITLAAAAVSHGWL